MGVISLLGHCLANEEQCVEFVDLVGLAASRKDGIEILCDFYCVEHLLVSSFWKSLSQISENPYLELLGGEYASLGEYISKLIDDLRSLNIKLVMFVDGAKGSSVEGFQQKYNTWKSRHFRDLTKARQSLDILHQRCRTMQSMNDGIRPVLLEVQILESLQQCGCEVVQCTSFEADFVIARNLQNRPNAFAILSNDSDFCVFDNCKFIPFNLFDVNGDLGLGEKQRLPGKPVRLEVGIISSSKVWTSLGFERQNEMIELSIIRGNDFTNSYLQKFGESIGLGSRSQLKDAVQWIKKHRVVENNPILADEMRKDRRFEEAVSHARQFYLLTLSVDEVVVPQDYMTNYIRDGVEKCHYPSNVLAMHNGIYWHRMLVEDVGRHYPVAEVALASLRRCIYSMVLSPGNNRVEEFGRTPDREFNQCYVLPSPARFLPKLHTVPKDKIFKNLGTFHRIMSHQEPNFQTEWYRRYGWRNGFKCYILRYFLVLNFQQHLCVTLNEFLPLVALVFCQVDVEFYQGLCLLPDSRCVTLGNWFQDIYRHAFYFIGKLLHVSHEFPQPSHIFSGAVWTAFYMVSVQDIGSVGPENIQKIRKDLNNMIREKRHIIRSLVEGLFQFDTRF